MHVCCYCRTVHPHAPGGCGSSSVNRSRVQVAAAAWRNSAALMVRRARVRCPGGGGAAGGGIVAGRLPKKGSPGR